YEEELHRHVVRQIDGATAAALFRADGPSEGKAAGGEPQQSEASRAGVSWGLWVNTARNPRLRVVEWPGLGVAIEVPKQIALANVALRVLRLPFDDRRGRCSRGLAAVGGVLRAELLALPPPARRAGGWVVRQMTPLVTGVSVVPYPIPPAGTDPAAWRAQEPAAPLTFTMPIPDDVIVPLDYGGERDAGAAAAAAAAAAATADGADPAARGGAATGAGDEAAENEAAAAAAAREQEGATAESEQRRQQQQQLPEPQPRVGWWDDAAGCWSEEGISGIRFQPGRRLLTFSTARLGTLALLAPRARLLPYRSWDLRPTGGLGGATVALTLRPCAPLPEPLVIDIGPAWARLASPDLPELCGLIGRQLPPWQLLQRLADAGLHLLPDTGACGGGGLVGGGAEEAARADRGGKDEEMERAMCNDVSRICGAFLVASSRWNGALGRSRCCCRLSEVTDWEEGGRTGPGHAARIFSKERDSGERRVLLAVREGTEGVAFSDAPDRGAGPPQPPDFESVEAVVAAAKDPRGQLHFDLPSLLAGPPPELAPHPRAPALRAGPAALEAAAAFDAAVSEAVARVLCALRPFSNG
ncbi:flagellar associated protein, partial [Monoraphidium neglectum]